MSYALHEIYPATVDSYDAVKRTVRIAIPPLTYGAQELPEAVISYPIGDKSDHTELRILRGDKIWVQFINGDPRYPIVIGYRATETGNANEWRKFHHANFRFDAITGDFVVVAAGSVRIEAASNITIKAGANIRLEAVSVDIVSSSLKHNGVNVGDTHIHPQNNGNHFGGDTDTGLPH
jgi:hypothetical protein